MTKRLSPARAFLKMLLASCRKWIDKQRRVTVDIMASIIVDTAQLTAGQTKTARTCSLDGTTYVVHI
jgi:hypothetical protein